MKSTIHLIRHGHTEGTEKKWYYGKTDVPLSQRGIEETKMLKMENVYPDGNNAEFYTTGLSRAKDTLKLIYDNVPFKVIRNLEEMDFGEYECVPFAQVEKDPVFLKWGYDKSGDKKLPGGESWNQFYERVGDGLKELLNGHRINELSNRHKEKEAISILVAHGGVIATIMMHLFPQKNIKTVWDYCPKPGHGYSVIFQDGKAVDIIDF